MTTRIISEKKLKKVKRIHGVLENYFSSNPDKECIDVATLMPLLIERGIFLKNTENGLPLRTLLLELHHAELLTLFTKFKIVIEKRRYYFYPQ